VLLVHVSVQKSKFSKRQLALLALVRHDCMLLKLVPVQMVFANEGGVAKMALELKLALVQLQMGSQAMLVLESLAADVTFESHNRCVDVVSGAVRFDEALRGRRLFAKLALEHAFLGVIVFDVMTQAIFVVGLPAANGTLDVPLFVRQRVRFEDCSGSEVLAAHFADEGALYNTLSLRVLGKSQVIVQGFLGSEIFAAICAKKRPLAAVRALVLLQRDLLRNFLGQWLHWYTVGGTMMLCINRKCALTCLSM
jgi:hypothetical protein